MDNQLTTAQTIAAITREHLKNGGLLFGQCVSAVGWIGGTVPSDPNIRDKIIEIPMTDVAGPGFAVGAALMGKRPIFVVRYQGFMWLNASPLINYAAKSKAVWNQPCPVFIRALGMEGNGVGHTASGSLHSLFMHSPGTVVEAPMSPKEYSAVWDRFINNDDPVYCSEHRSSYTLTEETAPHLMAYGAPRITIFPISAARLPVHEYLRTIGQTVCDVFPIVTLKPFSPTLAMQKSLLHTGLGLVVDCGYELTGAARSIAYDLTHSVERPVYALGLEDRVCGAAPRVENITPSVDRIARTIKDLLQKYK